MASQSTVGFLTDPDMPAQIGEHLAANLPELLDRHEEETHQGGQEHQWAADTMVDPVVAGQHKVQSIVRMASDTAARYGWDYVICLTDLPLRHGPRPVLADIDRQQRVAILALPSLGGLQPQRRARQLVARIMAEFTATGNTAEETRSQARGLQSRLTRLTGPIYRDPHSQNQRAIDVRYHATRGRGQVRLLTGMVRTNRPWRLIFGMSSALAAAIATSAFGLSSSTIWTIALNLSPLTEVAAAVASIAVLGLWLITAHRLWETSSNHTDRRLARLYNASTVATLGIGMGCLYVGLFVLNLAVAAFLVPSSVLASLTGSTVGPGSYFHLAWGFTTMGVLAGAMGSSLESDQAVRQAAYGYREQQRRANYAHQDHSTSPGQQAPAHSGPAPDEENADSSTDNTGANSRRQPNKSELYAEAQRRGITGRSAMSKHQLHAALTDNTTHQTSPTRTTDEQ